MTRIFHWFCMWKMDPMSDCDILLVFTLPPRDSTLQYKSYVHLWNNFPCIITLSITMNIFITSIQCCPQRTWLQRQLYFIYFGCFSALLVCQTFKKIIFIFKVSFLEENHENDTCILLKTNFWTLETLKTAWK